jgi:glycosyltransferase involved in cell wall biosynthesis
MKILFISSFYLFEQTRFGGTKRLYLLAKELEKNHDVHLLCLDACFEVPGREKAGEVDGFRNSLCIPFPAPRPFLRKIFCPSVDYRREIEKDGSAVAFLHGLQKIDCTFLAYPMAIQFTDTVLTLTRNITYLEDDLLLETYRNDSRRGLNFVRRALKIFQYRKTKSFYIKQLEFIHKMAVISGQEERVVRSYFPWVTTYVVKYGIDCEKYPILEQPSGLSLGFIGNFNHPPNRVSLEYFLRRIFPYLVARMPEMKFFVAGSGVPETMKRRFGRENRIRWLGEVADLRDFYGRISVFVNPAIQGRGLRTKVVEAAAFGRPVISTPLGREGLEDIEILTAETAEQYHDCCLRIVTGQDYINGMVLRNRAVVDRSYSTYAVAGQLERALTAG